MTSTIGMLLKWMLCLASAALMLLPAGAIGLFAPAAGMAIIRQWARLQLALFGIVVAVEDRNGGHYGSPPYLFVQLNQTSLSETLILPPQMPLPYTMLMNVEYALLPFIGWCHVLCHNVVVVRQSPRLARRAIDRATRLLAGGRNLVISIEGQRSRDGRLAPYKKGPAVMAIRARATIVPFFVRGARARMPWGAWRIQPGAASVTLCERIPTRGLTHDDRDALVARLRAIADRVLEPGK